MIGDSGHSMSATDAVPVREQLVPADWGIALDPGVHRSGDGRVLLGGSPLRLLRLAPKAVEVVARWEQGAAVGRSPAARRLARRLLDAGLADPRPAGDAPFGAPDVTVVIPVRDDPDGATAAVDAALRAGVGAVVVVDDGSRPPLRLEPRRSGSAAVRVVRRPASGGPGVARSVGLATVTTPLVAFVDADTDAPADWLEGLLPYFADPAVGAVAPRITSRPGPSVRERFEAVHSPLDLGARGARVAPRTTVAYVPTAALVARAAAVRDVGGFDPGLRFGEDVDLVWRLVGAGWTIRYVPTVAVTHEPRGTWRAWLRQRVGYGSAAAPLALRHPGSVPPVQVSAWSAAAWTAVAAGHPVAGLATAAASAALLPRKLGALDRPWPDGLRLAGRGHLHAGRWLARAVTRAWWPAALASALVSRRARRAVLVAAVLPPLLDWRERRPGLDPLRYVALRLADDVAYGAGVWRGSIRSRTVAALLPDLHSWPGKQRVTEAGTGG